MPDQFHEEECETDLREAAEWLLRVYLNTGDHARHGYGENDCASCNLRRILDNAV